MRLLAIETSGDFCGVAAGDGANWHVREEHAAQAHSERALVLVDAVLADCGWSLANLDGIAFGAGPGSFTGVRLACGVAQGLAYGADLPTVAIPTLLALAQSHWRSTGDPNVLACIDARVREVYVAAYARKHDAWEEVSAPAVVAPVEVQRPDTREWVGSGNGFAAYPDLASQLRLLRVDSGAHPTAQAVGELAVGRLCAGEGVPAAAARPVYVRHRVALTMAERAAGVRL